MMLALYRLATHAVTPLLPLYLARRKTKGKEDAARIRERFGHASMARPEGPLLWVHAASVGEANAALPLIDALRRARPGHAMLLTTGTVTSARLMRERLPAGVLHQFVPVDTPAATSRFVAHWHPEVALMVESELWPNLVTEAKRYRCTLLLVNARMSEASFHGWKRFSGMARELLGYFSGIYAQSEADAARFRALGAPSVKCVGNVKFDSPPLPAEAAALASLERACSGRMVWLAASLHPGEDAMVAEVHARLKARLPKLLTVIVPRHPEKGAAMATMCEAGGLRTSLRSENGVIEANTDVYIADTLGELGLFYRAFPLCFIGGSLISHGGQNPLEAARLGCTVLFGPYMHNFADIASGLLRADAAMEVRNAEELSHTLSRCFDALEGGHLRAGYAARASAWMLGKSGVNDALLAEILPHLARASTSHAA